MTPPRRHPHGHDRHQRYAASRPQTTPYRFTLALGDLAGLCGDLGTVAGRKKALQLLDLYPEPIGAHDQATETELYRAALDHARAVLGGEPDAARLRAALSLLVQDAPANPQDPPTDRSQTSLTGALSLLLPGTFCFAHDSDLDAPLTDKRREQEDRLYAGNDALGMFPVTVTVEKQQDGAWQVAASTQIQIQLADPHAGAGLTARSDARVLQLPDFVPPDNPALHVDRAAWRTPLGGVRGYVRRTLNDHFDAADPQGVNLRQQRGGARGETALGHLLRRAPGGPALTAGRPHAVKATTDAAGQVKFLFSPSRVAGDRFKLRLFVDPWDGGPCDGTRATHPRAESGVLTVYKTIRLAGVVQKPLPANLARWETSAPNGRNVVPNTQTLGVVEVDHLQTYLRRAFLLLRHGATTRDFDDASYRAALSFVRAHIGQFLAGKHYDLDAAVPEQLWFAADTDPAHAIAHLDAGGATATVAGRDAHAHGTAVIRGIDTSGAEVTESFALHGRDALIGTTAWRSIISVRNTLHGQPIRCRVTLGARALDVERRVYLPLEVTARSSSAADHMAVELFGFNEMSPPEIMREVLRLNGTHPVVSRYTYQSLCGARVLPDDHGAANQGTVSFAPRGHESWPTLELAPGAGPRNLTPVSAFESPHLLTMEIPQDYNARRRRSATAMRAGGNGWRDYSELADACLVALGKFLTGNATGITVTRALSGDPASNSDDCAYPYKVEVGIRGVPAFPVDSPGAEWAATTSGVACRVRACHVFYSNEEYAHFPYRLTANALHEMGHVLFLRHQWTSWTRRQLGNGDGNPADHDFHDVCVMSYQACDGDLCGRCVLKLQGAKLTGIPAND